MLTTLTSMIRDDEGATMVEYGLLVALIALVALAAVTTLGTHLSDALQRPSRLHLDTPNAGFGGTAAESDRAPSATSTYDALPIWFTLAGCIVASYCDVRRAAHSQLVDGIARDRRTRRSRFSGLQPVGGQPRRNGSFSPPAARCVYSRGGIGGGDIKLAIAGSGMLSYPLCVPFLLYTAIGGGLLAVLFLAFRRNAARLALACCYSWRPAGGIGIAAKRATLPYAVAFAFGAILVALSQSVAPFLRITF